MIKRNEGDSLTCKFSENGGTVTITEPGKMAETLRDYAVKHYGQVNHTIFGHGDGHDLLTDDPMTNPVYETFFDGTFMETEHLPNRTDDQNLFIKHMESKLPGGAEDELKSMAEPMTLKE